MRVHKIKYVGLKRIPVLFRHTCQNNKKLICDTVIDVLLKKNNTLNNMIYRQV